MNIKITKLPDDLDLDKIVKERMIETYRRCPYCFDKEFNKLLEQYKNNGMEPKDAHKRADDTLKRRVDYTCIWTVEKRKGDYYEKVEKPLPQSNTGIFSRKKKYKWQHIEFECTRCGMKWNSPDYPVGLCGDSETCNAIFNSYMNAREADISTFLIGCVNSTGV